MSEESKDIFILGGPNGAGKTTAARVLLPEFFHQKEYLNADEIAREIAPHDPDSVAIAAGREFIARMRRLIESGESFAFETMLWTFLYSDSEKLQGKGLEDQSLLLLDPVS